MTRGTAFWEITWMFWMLMSGVSFQRASRPSSPVTIIRILTYLLRSRVGEVVYRLLMSTAGPGAYNSYLVGATGVTTPRTTPSCVTTRTGGAVGSDGAVGAVG